VGGLDPTPGQLVGDPPDSWNELMRGMSPFIRHRMVLIGAMAAPEGAAYGECTDAVD
jgi:hypothetical protein